MREKSTVKKELSKRILEGIKKAYIKLVEETAARNGSLVVERNGKVQKVPASQLLEELRIAK